MTRKFKTIICVFMVVSLLSVSACRPLSELAPTVEMMGGGVGGQLRLGDVESLERGRRIYVKDCARCHSVLAVQDYSAADWHDELPDMVEESKLNVAQERDLRAYIAAALGYEPVKVE